MSELKDKLAMGVCGDITGSEDIYIELNYRGKRIAEAEFKNDETEEKFVETVIWEVVGGVNPMGDNRTYLNIGDMLEFPMNERGRLV